MKLNFHTTWQQDMPAHLAGKPTHFAEKIIYNLRIEGHITKAESYDLMDKLGWVVKARSPKLHTIRFLTKKEAMEWQKPTTSIKFLINDNFQFAPEIPVVSLQKLYFFRHRITTERYVSVNKFIHSENPNLFMDELAINDGFETVEDFFAYFSKERVEAKAAEGKMPYIIHWTDLKY